MSLLYKKYKDQTIRVDIKILSDQKIILNFYSDCGKFGTEEALDGFLLTPKRLLEILQKEEDNTDGES